MKENMPFASLELIYEKICHSQLSKKLAYFYFKVLTWLTWLNLDKDWLKKHIYSLFFSECWISCTIAHDTKKSHLEAVVQRSGKHLYQSLCEILSRRSVFPRPLGWSHVHACVNFLVQIVRSLSEESRGSFKKKNCFDFSRLLLFVWVRICCKIGHNFRSLFLNKVEGLRPAILLKRRLWHSCFPLNSVKFLRTPFYREQFWWLLLHASACTWFNLT